MVIQWDMLQGQSTERLEALETQIAENVRRELEAKRRELEEQGCRQVQKRKENL